MFKRRLLVALAALPLHAPRVWAQPASPASAARPRAPSIDAMLRAHVRDYFGTEGIPKAVLGIKAVNGVAFDDLKHRLSMPKGGAVEYWGGRPIPDAGVALHADFENGTLVVEGVADGKGGFASFTKVTAARGTRLELNRGGRYIWRGRAWQPQ